MILQCMVGRGLSESAGEVVRAYEFSNDRAPSCPARRVLVENPCLSGFQRTKMVRIFATERLNLRAWSLSFAKALRRRRTGPPDDGAAGGRSPPPSPAMLEEARAAESKRDFVSKCCIALKEARESHVRLKVCCRSGIGPAELWPPLIDEANQIVSILTAIVRNTRQNAGLGAAVVDVVAARIPNS